MNEHFFIYNGNFFRTGIPVIDSQNRSFRYGDGVFETMRMRNGRILNADFHLERLFSGMKILQFDIPPNFSSEYFTNTVNELLSKNSILENARIRLMVFRGNEGIFDIENNATNYIIEAFPFSEKIELNETGLELGIFPDAKKSYDLFSNIKTNNYLASVMAARFAKKNNWDDAIILNSFERICESAVANIFIIAGTEICTPLLSEGCVAGTMRRWMLEKLDFKNYLVSEKKLSVNELLNADEMFLTNSIYQIKWVKNFGNKTYSNKKIKEIFEYVIQNI